MNAYSIYSIFSWLVYYIVSFSVCFSFSFFQSFSFGRAFVFSLYWMSKAGKNGFDANFQDLNVATAFFSLWWIEWCLYLLAYYNDRNGNDCRLALSLRFNGNAVDIIFNGCAPGKCVLASIKTIERKKRCVTASTTQNLINGKFVESGRKREREIFLSPSAFFFALCIFVRTVVRGWKCVHLRRYAWPSDMKEREIGGERSRSVVDLFCTHIALPTINFRQESTGP